MSQKLKLRISFSVGLISWALFTFFDIYTLILNRYEIREDLTGLMPQVFFTFFVLASLVFYRYKVTKAESINFLDLLWKVFITGLVTTIISLAIQGFFILFEDTAIATNPITINFFYHLYSGIVVVYLVSTFVVWKRLILYQKSKNLIQLWNFFEYTLYGSLVFDFLGFQFGSNNYNIAMVFITGFSVVLCLNLKWVAYLNFKQKWKSILFIILSAIYLYHFLVNLNNFSSESDLIIDLMDRVFIVAVLIFIFIYAAFSVLVTLFNLPTSSVFERKLKEAVDFQKLSQAIPSGQNVEQTYDILLDSSMNAVFADAAWLEVRNGDATRLILRNLKEEEVEKLKSKIKNEAILKLINFDFDNHQIGTKKIMGGIRSSQYRSILALPIMVKNEQMANLVLLQEVNDAFNREMLEIITTFVSQASISLENAFLLQDALENERYKEQLNIAKNVQKSLLPDELQDTESFQISAFSMAADEVGGDYYDLIKLDETKYGLIIGDVSGKGTSAAFNMAQMKGVFYSLIQLQLSPAEFIKKANLALGKCLEKSSFLTTSYFEINSAKKEMKFVRAGHCPTLMYCGKEKVAKFLTTKGMGLGILRNDLYDPFVVENTLAIESGDIIVLYTDGITEAANISGEQFGEEGLRESFLKYVENSPEEISKGIISDLHGFMESSKLDDDYTIVIMKIK